VAVAVGVVGLGVDLFPPQAVARTANIIAAVTSHVLIFISTFPQAVGFPNLIGSFVMLIKHRLFPSMLSTSQIFENLLKFLPKLLTISEPCVNINFCDYALLDPELFPRKWSES
jgi:hypothetical protein